MRQLQKGAFRPQLMKWSPTPRSPWLAVIGAMALDRLVKLVVPATSIYGGGLISVYHSLNLVGPFSLPIPSVVLVTLAVVALAVIGVLAVQFKRRGHSDRLFGVLLMLVGGLSNLSDRLMYGGVIDVFHATWWSTLSFNLADLYLLAGLAILTSSKSPGLATIAKS